MIEPAYYKPAQAETWTGRIDGTAENQLRWHQLIKTINLNDLSQFPIGKNNVFLGFACDEGVRRNKGRIGAADAPRHIRNACCNFPAIGNINFYDAGDIVCFENNLEEAQRQLSLAVESLLQAGAFPILLGGGHEITFGHYSGIKNHYSAKTIGIINFDAHFDLRIPDKAGISSGTGFWQIAQETNKTNAPFKYLAIGIQKAGNTQELFDRANQLGVSYILDSDFNPYNADKIEESIQTFCKQTDHLYITIDMDVFSAAYAPGVSAINAKGIAPDYLFDRCLEVITQSGKMVSIDFAETNPSYDLDSRTAKLTARLIYEIGLSR